MTITQKILIRDILRIIILFIIFIYLFIYLFIIILFFSKLINKSVRHTVDMRALTKTPPPTASTAEKTEAIEENMLLVVESARAIGCSVTDNMVDELTRGDKGTIDKLIIELIKVSVY